jgi:hypothetical protein
LWRDVGEARRSGDAKLHSEVIYSTAPPFSFYFFLGDKTILSSPYRNISRCGNQPFSPPPFSFCLYTELMHSLSRLGAPVFLRCLSSRALPAEGTRPRTLRWGGSGSSSPATRQVRVVANRPSLSCWLLRIGTRKWGGSFSVNSPVRGGGGCRAGASLKGGAAQSRRVSPFVSCGLLDAMT